MKKVCGVAKLKIAKKESNEKGELLQHLIIVHKLGIRKKKRMDKYP
jgi:hypothetical protein